jgi:two-component system CheB/CheR fusion protein
MASDERATVLIVEDDLGLAHLVRARLERAGHIAETAATAEEGMERVRRGGVDLLVLDQRLPSGVSGLQLYERIKAAGFEAPAILATGFSDEATLLQALRAGVRDFVPKAADYLNYLVPAVARVLKEVRTERELAESRAGAREALRRQRELETEIAERKIAEKEREKAQQALRDADLRKDEFLAMLAHELRNPLAPIRNALEMLKLVEASPELQRQTREMMERQVQLMVRLVDDLLDVSRITRGKIELCKEPIELAAVVARAVETARPLIEARNHELTTNIAPGSLLLQGDLVRLGQVVANLLNNASKYMAPGGRIWLKGGRERDQIVLHVRDAGIGIAPEMLPQVFDLFTQADHPPSLSQGGLGIGLTLVRRLVEMHGGKVEAHSEGLGKGSEFVVRLPALPDVHPSIGERKKDAAAGPAPARRVLVVDDNVDSADSLAELLRVWGHEVQAVYDGSQALAAAPGFRPEVALLDIDMPDMSGYELARQLRTRDGLDATAYVALTGYGQEEDRRRSAAAGFRAHLVKPVDPEALRQLLATLAND